MRRWLAALLLLQRNHARATQVDATLLTRASAMAEAQKSP
jgi:hypothetical protein